MNSVTFDQMDDRAVHVALTGLPTLLARRLTQCLLERPQVHVHAIVKPAFSDAAQAFHHGLAPDIAGRLHLLEGDVASMDLGLSAVELRELGAKIEVIHHAAQVTYLGVEDRLAEQVNVRGTRETLELARLCTHLRTFVFHSTAYVSGDRRGIALETELDVGQKPRNVVEATKLKAEKIVRAAKDIPSVIVRPGTVIGDSETGEVDRLDGPYLLVLLLLASPAELAIPLPSRGDIPLHLVPVDWVARASVALGNDPAAVGKCFHLVDRSPVTLKETYELVAKAAGKRVARGFIPANFTKALLRMPGLERLVRSPRAYFDQLATPIRFDTTNADMFLKNLALPSFESYVEPLVGYVRERMLDDRKRREDVRHPDEGTEREIEDSLS